jgi:hypothetical protein
LLASNLRSHELLQRINGDGEDQCPYHQSQERRKDLKAEHCQGKYESGTDKDIKQTRGAAGPELNLRLAISIHASLPAVAGRVWFAKRASQFRSLSL